jgi:hypothetical protein
LVEYVGSSGNLQVKLSDLAKRIILPLNKEERATAVWEALSPPAINGEVLAKYPNWDLPSDETLPARLVRENDQSLRPLEA